jgi:hypothetical protein
MATQSLDNNNVRVDTNGTIAPIRAADARLVTPLPEGIETIDPVQALIELGEMPEPVLGGLADQLLAWVAPRPRNPATLTQSRIVPLLGTAADLLTQAVDTSDDIAALGGTALAQELRMQRALADRRATLIKGDT